MEIFTVTLLCMLFAFFHQGDASNQCEVTEPYFCNDKENGNYGNHDYYHGYYACWNGQINCMECAKASPKLFYHPDKDYCDYEPPCPNPDVFCGIVMDGMTPTEKARPSRNANPMYKFGYIQCQLGNNKCKRCKPDGVEFNSDTKTCTPSGCDKMFCKGRDTGNYHNPSNPHGYMACSNGYTYCMPCAAGHNGNKLFFHRKADMCKYNPDSTYPNKEDYDEGSGGLLMG